MGTYTFTHPQAEPFDRSVWWKPAGVAQDLTGWSAAMQIRKRASSSTAAVSLTSGDGLTLGADGEVAILIAQSVLAAMRPGYYEYSIEVYEPESDRPHEVLSGRFDLTAEVTR